MKTDHISLEHWLRYVNNDLDDRTREQYEAHLYSCDQCLELYITAVESQEQTLPAMQKEAAFTDLVMQEIAAQNGMKKAKNTTIRKKEQHFYKKTMFHYFIAAAMTILLMSSGVFTQVMDYVNTFEKTPLRESDSIVEGLINHSFSLLDILEEEHREGNKHDK